MKPKAARRKKSLAVRLRPFWIVLTLLLVAAAAAGYYLASWPGFFPKYVTVAGNEVVPAAEIRRRAAISPHQNVWLQNLGAAAARIEGIPYIATARLFRIPPAGVRIFVTERHPYAVVADGTRRVLVDRRLRVLQPAPPANDLPVFVLPGKRNLVDGTFLRGRRDERMRKDYAQLVAGHVIVTRLWFGHFGGLVAALRGGVDVLFGNDDDLRKKIPLVDPILSQLGRGGRAIRVIDLRAATTPVVEYRPRSK
ncbi:MAG: cell division protein FtsQ/DivIB [Vulcanimicrobiaceae bacterium]